MRSKTVKRFYCDHCSKGMFRKADMANHEASCTMNPERVCYMCNMSPELSEIIKSLHARPDVEFHDYEAGVVTEDCRSTKSKEAIKWLFDQCDQCPACVLSVLRQGKVYAFDVFNYKESVGSWRKERNEEFRTMIGM